MACFVLSCKSHSSRKDNDEFVSFHRMRPNDRENWCKVLIRARNCWTRHSRICSKHFTDDCFVCSDKWRRLKPGAIPSLLLDTDDDENLHPNPGQEPMQIIKVEHNYPTTNHADSQVNLQAVHLTSCQVKAEAGNQKGSSHAMEIDKNEMPMSSSSCCSVLINKMRKLEQDLEKVKKLCRKRLLRINALRKQTKRLKLRNLTLQDIIQKYS